MDISDNTVRGCVLTKLIERASLDAGETPAPWRSPVESSGSSFCFLPREQAVLLWKITIPFTGIVYVGQDPTEVDPASPSQDHLPKIMASTTGDCRHHVGGITAVEPFYPPHRVREILRSFAAQKLWTHPLNTLLVKQRGENQRQIVTPITSTTLAEAVASFALHTPADTRVSLVSQKSAYNCEDLGKRLCEIKVGVNGFKMTDRSAVYRSASPDVTLYSVLHAHVVHFDSLAYQVLPWEGHGDVAISSTQMWGLEELQGDTLYEAVAKAMKSKEPLQSCSLHKVETYEDGEGNLAVAYTPLESLELHFLIATKIT
jgi:hypothetical protein